MFLPFVGGDGIARGGDWPQILGPNRDGSAVGERLAERWGADGPATLWRHPVGSGFSGVAVAGRRAIVFHRRDDLAVVEALDAATGDGLWKTTFPTSYVTSIAPDDGPRCVPVIHDGRVFAFGADGDLHCLSLDSGKAHWSINVKDRFGSLEGYFGCGSSPIVVDGKLLLNVGGRLGAGIVALSPKTGETIWKSTNEAASYSSPVATTIDDQKHVIFVTRLSVVSLDPADGAVRFRFPFGKRGPTVNAASPLVVGRRLFVTASYGVGARMLRLSGDKAEPVWRSDSILSSQYASCVEHEGFLYGIDGRQDVGVARLRCVEAATGRVLWTEEGFGTATLIRAGDKLVIAKTDGRLVLAQTNPNQYTQLDAASIFTTTTRALPALAGGRLFLRDTRTLKCLDLSADARGAGK